MTTVFVDLDVRPTLRAGGEPFQEIIETVTALAPDQGLRLFATFRPVPLFSVMGAKGYTYEEKELEGGDWEVVFRPSQGAAMGKAASASASAAAETSDWPQPILHLDNRDLEPPEPMVRVLAATETLKTGEVLSALGRREPIFLLPELAKRGHAWRGAFEPDGVTYKILVRVGAAKASTV
jgi:uncharacterized protein (DUF2249 family)